jgi:hypothetical protein
LGLVGTGVAHGPPIESAARHTVRRLRS